MVRRMKLTDKGSLKKTTVYASRVKHWALIIHYLYKATLYYMHNIMVCAFPYKKFFILISNTYMCIFICLAYAVAAKMALFLVGHSPARRLQIH